MQTCRYLLTYLASYRATMQGSTRTYTCGTRFPQQVKRVIRVLLVVSTNVCVSRDRPCSERYTKRGRHVGSSELGLAVYDRRTRISPLVLGNTKRSGWPLPSSSPSSALLFCSVSSSERVSISSTCSKSTQILSAAAAGAGRAGPGAGGGGGGAGAAGGA